jgi:AcrR family transcriptional regulator
MDTRGTLVAAALKVLEQDGEAQFSTRAVCAIAKVTAPTLYHHFGSADGLLSAAMTEAFGQFLARKKAAVQSSDPETALRQGWDDYVRFAAERPRLYAAMMSRLLNGNYIPAAEVGFALLRERIAALAAAGRLALGAEIAADLAWASANAAAQLHVTAAMRDGRKPDATVIDRLRDQALQIIITPKAKVKSR